MLVMVVMTVLCTVGSAFYVRFLVALGNECEPRLTGYWVRLRLGAHENAMAELQQRKQPATRAA